MLLALWLACGSPPPPSIFDDADGDGVILLDDCNDDDPAINPYATERCDPPGIDEDCDGWAEERDAIGAVEGWYDGDGDGWGQSARPTSLCDASLVAPRHGDCDDEDASVNPGAIERCDAASRDEDCDGDAAWFVDADGDGWGGAGAGSCGGATQHFGDCDDADPRVSPAAGEVCGNALDDDCDQNALPCAFEGFIRPEDATGSLPGLPLASGDLDGDGAMDLVTGAEGDLGWLQVWLAPIGAAPDFLTGPGGSVRGAAVLDLDGDGHQDLAFAVHPAGLPRVEVLYGPLGTSPPVVWTVADRLDEVASAGDTDGDAQEELLALADGNSWLVQGRPGDGALADAAHTVVPSQNAAALGDVDGDGLSDLGVYGMTPPCAFGVFLAPFAPVLQPADAVACRDLEAFPAIGAQGVGDLDGDGLADVVVAFRVHWYDGIDTHSFTRTFPLYGGQLGEGSLHGAPYFDADYAMHAGDTDGDGLSDLLLFQGGTGHTLLDGSAGGARGTFTLGRSAVPASDYDGDGTIDVVLGDGSRSWWFGASGHGG